MKFIGAYKSVRSCSPKPCLVPRQSYVDKTDDEKFASRKSTSYFNFEYID